MSAKEPGAHPEILRLRSALYDRITGLPALPLLFDTMRTMLEGRRAIGILHASIPDITLAESVYGWRAFDRINARMAASLQSLRGTLLADGTRFAQPGVHGGELIVVVPGRTSGGEMDGGALAGLAHDVEAALRVDFASEEFATMVPPLTPKVGHALLSEDPFYRFERLVYRAVDDARAVRSQREQRVRRSWTDEILQIIREEGIRIHYQPVVELSSLDVIGYEALSRGPEGSGLESPAVLFRISAEAGIVHELERVCRRAALSSARGIAPGRKIFVNTRAEALGDPAWSDTKIERSLEQLQLRPRDLIVEIPQPGASADEPLIERLVRALKGRGFGIAIDDIGTGYAGIQAIERLVPDYLKIDISLVRGIERNLIQQDLLAAVVGIGRRIGADVIAEGIESESELSYLRSHGARYGQGFLFSAAVPGLVPGPVSLARVGR